MFNPDPKPEKKEKEKKVYRLKRTPLKKDPTYRMPKQSKRRKKEALIYSKERIKFLAGKTCFIDGCNKPADTIEHTMGRTGDLYLDQKYWQPCCWSHNTELEKNTELSRKYQKSKLHGGKKG